MLRDRQSTLALLGVFFLTMSALAGCTTTLTSRTLDNGRQGRFSNYDPDAVTRFQRTANSFQLASAALLCDVHWFGYFESPVIAPTFRIRLFEDESGLPGKLFYEQIVNPDVMDTGLTIQLGARNVPIFGFSADPIAAAGLNADVTYWISIAHAATATTEFLWSRADSSDGDVALRGSEDEVWQALSPGSSQRDHAFRLTGKTCDRK